MCRQTSDPLLVETRAWYMVELGLMHDRWGRQSVLVGSNPEPSTVEWDRGRFSAGVDPELICRTDFPRMQVSQWSRRPHPRIDHEAASPSAITWGKGRISSTLADGFWSSWGAWGRPFFGRSLSLFVWPCPSPRPRLGQAAVGTHAGAAPVRRKRPTRSGRDALRRNPRPGWRSTPMVPAGRAHARGQLPFHFARRWRAHAPLAPRLLRLGPSGVDLTPLICTHTRGSSTGPPQSLGACPASRASSCDDKLPESAGTYITRVSVVLTCASRHRTERICGAQHSGPYLRSTWQPCPTRLFQRCAMRCDAMRCGVWSGRFLCGPGRTRVWVWQGERSRMAGNSTHRASVAASWRMELHVARPIRAQQGVAKPRGDKGHILRPSRLAIFPTHSSPLEAGLTTLCDLVSRPTPLVHNTYVVIHMSVFLYVFM